MAIYLKFGNLKGNVTADGYAGHIAIGSANFSVLRKVSMEAGNLSNRESSKPVWTGIEITKIADSSTTTLLKEAATGAAGQEATITFVRTGSNKVEEFLVYKLTDCIISEYHFGGQGESQPVERITLSYSAIETSYKDHDASNKAGNPQRFRYDLKTAKAS